MSARTLSGAKIFTAVGEVSKHSAGHLLSQFGLVQQLLGQADIRYVCRRELVGDGHPVGGQQQMELHAVDREGSPPYPCSSAKELPQPAD